MCSRSVSGSWVPSGAITCSRAPHVLAPLPQVPVRGGDLPGTGWASIWGSAPASTLVRRVLGSHLTRGSRCQVGAWVPLTARGEVKTPREAAVGPTPWEPVWAAGPGSQRPEPTAQRQPPLPEPPLHPGALPMASKVPFLWGLRSEPRELQAVMGGSLRSHGFSPHP